MLKIFEKKIDNFINNQFYVLFVLFLLFFLYRLLLLKMDAFPFNSDEAIVGLMGKHIIDGERPIFFYGQSYMGSLDAYFVALSFLIFGEKVIAIRLVQLILFFLTIVNIYFYVIIAFQNKKAAFFSALFLIFAPVNLILYTTVSLGGYTEALLIGSIVMLLSTKYFQAYENNRVTKNNKFRYLLAIGFFTGLGLWVNPISLTITVPMVFLVFIKIRIILKKFIKFFQNFFLILVGFLLGSFFWWYQIVINNKLSILTELFGSAVSVEKGSFLQIIYQHFVSFLLFAPTVLLGIRPPWDTIVIGKFFVPIVLLFWILVFAFLLSYRERISETGNLAFISLLGIPLMVLAGFIFTSFGTDPSGRYFLPIYIPLAIWAGFALSKFNRPLILCILGFFVIIYHLFGVISMARKAPYITTQFYEPAQVNQKYMNEIISFLEKNDEKYGFTNYWVSYPLAFLSDEEIISVPFLPYHPDLTYTSRDNRIPSYNEVLKFQKKYFFITTNNPELDKLLLNRFLKNGIDYEYEFIGDFHIYYALSHPVDPEKLGLYEFYK